MFQDAWFQWTLLKQGRGGTVNKANTQMVRNTPSFPSGALLTSSRYIPVFTCSGCRNRLKTCPTRVFSPSFSASSSLREDSLTKCVCVCVCLSIRVYMCVCYLLLHAAAFPVCRPFLERVKTENWKFRTKATSQHQFHNNGYDGDWCLLSVSWNIWEHSVPCPKSHS